MGIDLQNTEHIAVLSRLDLSDNEIPIYADQLSKILNYVDQLNDLDTTDVEPTSHILNLTNVVRDDEIIHSLSSEQIFQNAPEQEEAFFKVPQIMGEKRK